MIRRTLMTACVAAGLVLALGAPSFGGSGGVASGDGLLLVDADGGAPMFEVPDMAVGAPHERCTQVTNAGSRAVDARVFAHTRGRLRNTLQVEITRGALPPGMAFPACAGFVPDITIDRGLGPGVIFRGTVGDLSGSFARATADPGTWAAGETRAYRFVVTLVRMPSRPDLATTASFVWKCRAAA